MKDRLRETVFNIVGPSVRNKHAIDLFAGTGALGLEALSRGAARATLIEQHFPTARIIRQNVATLRAEADVQIVTGDVFFWANSQPELGPEPQIVFCSPPYRFYVERTEDMLRLIGPLMKRAPAESIVVVESDCRFDFGLLPEAEAWQVRTYQPAMLGIYHKPD
jgi:16S rRNA (guanine966-N2)-methyltransferase